MDGIYATAFETANELMGVEAFPSIETAEALPSPTDLLIERVRSGDLQAFESLMQLTERLVFSVAWRVLGDREQAKDAAQETFLRVFRSLDRFRMGESFPAWVCQITVNVCRDLARKRGPIPVDVEDLDSLRHPGAHSEAEEVLLSSQRRALVQGALKSLPHGERTALVLRDIEGFSTEEVARVLGVRPVTIRTQVASARAKVRVYCDQMLHRTSGGRR